MNPSLNALLTVAAIVSQLSLASRMDAQQVNPRPRASDSAPNAARAGAVTESAGDAEGSHATATAAVAYRAKVAPVIDGRPDDAAWRDAQVIDQFLEYDPTTGATPRFKTEVRVLYDDKYLYVLGRMFDPAPDSIVSLLSRRDVRTNSEQLKLIIDSYHDRRTAYQFILNPAGVKRDFYVYNDNVEDGTWDAVWDGQASIDSLGWVAEFRIPLSQLRFPKADEHTFGLMIVRDVARTAQRISWPLYHRDRQGLVSQAGELSGLRGLGSPHRLELSPYAVTKNVTQPRVGAGEAAYTHPTQTAMGMDLKYGITSNLTIDATVNPDFGQVEADPSVLNLGAFEQFFDERRPFFLEGAGIFSFRTACQDIDTGCTGLFYSRRIGRNPQLSGAYGDAASPQFSTILGATKLTGRLGTGLSVGVMDAVTQREQGTLGRTIEPGTNYFVARAQQDLNDGQSGVGAMFTAVNRNMDEFSAPYLRGSAYTGGVDMRHRFSHRNYELFATLSGSTVNGAPDAILRLQRDGVHRYQRPDDALELDPTRTSLTGFAQRVSLSKFGGGITRFQSVYQRYTPGFETNDLGFQPSADQQLFRNWFSLQLTNPTKLYRRANLNFNAQHSWTASGMPTGMGLNVNWHLQFLNQMWGHLGMNASGLLPTYDDRVARGGPAVRNSSSTSMWAGLEGDYRRRVTPALFGGRYSGDEGETHGAWVNPTLELRASSRFSASLGVNVSKDVSGAQWVGNYGVAGVDTTHYTFAKLDQTTVNMTTRVNVTATRNLSLQAYVAPYVSTGTFSRWRELSSPRAQKFDDRFRPFAGDPGGLDFKQLRSNTVVRYEYRPGSTLFLVWQHGRSDYDPTATDFQFRRDYGRLLKLHPDNTFLVKVSYWLNP